MTSSPVGGRCPRCAPFHLAGEQRRRAKPHRRVWDRYLWQVCREKVWQRDRYTCKDCGRHRSKLRKNERLMAHHRRSVLACIRDGTAFDPDECDTLCSTCSGKRDGRFSS